MTQTLRSGVLKDDDIMKLRLAALLHDIGHYPLSHTGESVYCQIGTGLVKKNSKRPLHFVAQKGKKNDMAHHENIGLHVLVGDDEIGKILRECGVEPEEIGAIFRGNHQHKWLYNQLIHSEFDCDRLDYLVNLLVTCKLQVDDSQTFKELLALDEKGIHVLEHFLFGRYFAYAKVVNHRIAGIMETIAKAVMKMLIDIQDEGWFRTADEIKTNISKEKFYNFDDFMFWQGVRKYAENKNMVPKEYPELAIYANCLMQRNGIKVLFEHQELIDEVDKKHSENYYLLLDIVNNHLDEFANYLRLNTYNIGFLERRLDYIVH